MPRKRRHKSLDDLPPWVVGTARRLAYRFYTFVAAPYLKRRRAWPELLVFDKEEIYCLLEYTALRAALTYIPNPKKSLRKHVWRHLGYAFRREVKAQLHYLRRFSELSLYDLTDPTPGCLTHRIDDVPERDAPPFFDEVCRSIQADRVRALLERLPKRLRGPVWEVYAHEQDAFTASRKLGISLKECHFRAIEGMKRLQQMVAEDPSLLLPPDNL